jgi:hypothetical protein
LGWPCSLLSHQVSQPAQAKVKKVPAQINKICQHVVQGACNQVSSPSRQQHPLARRDSAGLEDGLLPIVQLLQGKGGRSGQDHKKGKKPGERIAELRCSP